MKHDDRRVSGFFVDISGRCNANCPHCAQRRLKSAKHFAGIMAPVLFGQILDHLLELELIPMTNHAPVRLYNWGEPSLNPEINSIIQILKKKRLFAGISSNFIMEPDIANENLSAISALTFSLSGFSQDTYARIHGASLTKVLSNFDRFYRKLREYSSNTSIYVAWHRYRFNEHEFWDAARYFNRPGIEFAPQVAYLNDYVEMMDFLRGRLPEDRRVHAELDLFLDHIRKGVSYCSTISANYHCPAWDYLVFDETGQLLLCCVVTGHDSDYILGNILQMSAEEIWQVKSNKQLCSDCISSGLAVWYYGAQYNNDKPWPSGGGLCRFKLWSRNLYYGGARSKIRKMILGLPNGQSLINTLKGFGKR